MKKLTSVIATVGIAGIAALGAVTPAAAATSEAKIEASSQAAPGDRVEGKLVFYIWGGTYEGRYVGYGDANGERVNAKLGNRDSVIEYAATYELPAPGAGAGPVIAPNGNCLTANLRENSDWDPLLNKPCDGSALQNWFVNESNQLEMSSTGLVASSTHTSWSDSAMVANSNTMNRLELSTLTPVERAVPVDITGPSGTVATPTPEFTGTGEPGASIIVKDQDGNVLCETTVGAGGAWSCTSGSELAVGSTTVTAEQTDTAGDKTSDSIEFVIVDEDPEGPIVAPAVAAIVGLAALTGAGVTALRRRANA
ncbi:Ig-like domain-containing protein [Microbacterium sp. NPDC089695]|uniref:Ig-like domain-containing protein n=1 Tax=Microbacterium sp. NPDC089695 TaxID=3364198 RepID=UPI0037F32E2A